MNKIKIFEKTENGWIEGLNFDYLIVGRDFISKTICFSPVDCNIADLKVRIEEKNDFVFVKSKDHLITEWKSIPPFKIMKGEMSDPVKIEFLVKTGPARLDNFLMKMEYLEIPSETE